MHFVPIEMVLILLMAEHPTVAHVAHALFMKPTQDQEIEYAEAAELLRQNYDRYRLFAMGIFPAERTDAAYCVIG